MANANKKVVNKPEGKKVNNEESYDIKVDTGAINVLVRDKDGDALGHIKINPADMDILKRYGKVADKFNAIEFEEGKEPTDEELIELSDMVKGQFDYLLNYPVSEVLFSKCSPLTIISDGDFYFENVMKGLEPVLEKITNKRVAKKMKKIKKYTDKYAPKYHN